MQVEESSYVTNNKKDQEKGWKYELTQIEKLINPNWRTCCRDQSAYMFYNQTNKEK